VVISAFTPRPLIRGLLFTPELFDVERVEAALDARGSRPAFNRVIAACTGWVAASFLLSAVLNYLLARWLVRSPSGTEAFNAEIGRMTFLSWPVIALPTTLVMMVALMKLMKGIEIHTGHVLDEVLHPDLRGKLAEKEAVRPVDS
jgi:hypothetical protein